MKRSSKEELIMGDYEARLMRHLDEQEEKMNRKVRLRKGFKPDGYGCYSTRGSHTDDDEDEWN